MAKTSWPVQSALYGRISHATPCREAAQSNGAFRTQPFNVPLGLAARLRTAEASFRRLCNFDFFDPIL